jgi:hypothetical protein
LTESGRSTVQAVSIGVSGLSLAAAVASIVEQWTAAEYAQRAGDVATGVLLEGSCSDVPELEWARSRADASERGTRGERCYPNDTCNAGLDCVKDRCRRAEKKDAGSREKPAQTPIEDENEY